MTTRPPLLLLGTLVLALPACGHKGDPRPPLRRTPPAPGEFHLAQRGSQLELSAVAPAASVDGVPLPAIAIEFVHGEGRRDLDKTGARMLVKAVPGARTTASLPVPAPGTLVRAIGRSVAGGGRSARTLTLALVAQPPLEPPRELQARLTDEGIALAWLGLRPKEIPPPVGPTTPGLPGQPPGTGPFAKPGAAKPGAAPPAAPPGPPAVSPAAATPTTPPAATPPGAAPPIAAAPATATSPAPATTGEAPRPGEPTKVTAPAPPPRRRSGFFVYRRVVNEKYDEPMGEEPLDRRTLADPRAPLGVKVCYVVRAVGSTEPLIESAASNEVCAERRDITPPAPPAGLAVLPRQGGLELLWSPSPEEDLAGYRVYRASGQGEPERLAELLPAQASFLDESAKKGVSYRYTLTAFDRAGNESAPSEPVEAALP
ncbi:MAG TPA: hypothetical protein VEQ10_06440 [Vicinamibacteria bacterium]|nr:hypothetical protein [Vicinamibacteria bacterium]